MVSCALIVTVEPGAWFVPASGACPLTKAESGAAAGRTFASRMQSFEERD